MVLADLPGDVPRRRSATHQYHLPHRRAEEALQGGAPEHERGRVEQREEQQHRAREGLAGEEQGGGQGEGLKERPRDSPSGRSPGGGAWSGSRRARRSRARPAATARPRSRSGRNRRASRAAAAGSSPGAPRGCGSGRRGRGRSTPRRGRPGATRSARSLILGVAKHAPDVYRTAGAAGRTGSGQGGARGAGGGGGEAPGALTARRPGSTLSVHSERFEERGGEPERIRSTAATLRTRQPGADTQGALPSRRAAGMRPRKSLPETREVRCAATKCPDVENPLPLLPASGFFLSPIDS